jgi:hypothetical protein
MLFLELLVVRLVVLLVLLASLWCCQCQLAGGIDSTRRLIHSPNRY